MSCAQPYRWATPAETCPALPTDLDHTLPVDIGIELHPEHLVKTQIAYRYDPERTGLQDCDLPKSTSTQNTAVGCDLHQVPDLWLSMFEISSAPRGHMSVQGLATHTGPIRPFIQPDNNRSDDGCMKALSQPIQHIRARYFLRR